MLMLGLAPYMKNVRDERELLLLVFKLRPAYYEHRSHGHAGAGHQDVRRLRT